MKTTLLVPRTCITECNGYVLSALGQYLEMFDPKVDEESPPLARIRVFSVDDTKIAGITPIFTTGLVAVHGGSSVTILQRKELSGDDFVVPPSRIYHFDKEIFLLHPLKKDDGTVQFAFGLEYKTIVLASISIENDVISMPSKSSYVFLGKFNVVQLYAIGSTWNNFEVCLFSKHSLVFWMPAFNTWDPIDWRADGEITSVLVTANRIFVCLSTCRLFVMKLGNRSRKYRPISWVDLPTSTATCAPNALSFSPTMSVLCMAFPNGNLESVHIHDGMAPKTEVIPGMGRIPSICAVECAGRLMFSSAVGALRWLPYDYFTLSQRDDWMLYSRKKLINFVLYKEGKGFIGQFLSPETGRVSVVRVEDGKEEVLLSNVDYTNWAARYVEGQETNVAVYSDTHIWRYTFFDHSDIYRFTVRTTGAKALTSFPKEKVESLVHCRYTTIVSLKSNSLVMWESNANYDDRDDGGRRLSLKAVQKKHSLEGPVHLTTGLALDMHVDSTTMDMERQLFVGTRDGAIIVINTIDTLTDACPSVAKIVHVVQQQKGVSVVDMDTDVYDDERIIVLHANGALVLLDVSGIVVATIPNSMSDFVPRYLLSNGLFIAGTNAKGTGLWMMRREMNDRITSFCIDDSQKSVNKFQCRLPAEGIKLYYLSERNDAQAIRIYTSRPSLLQARDIVVAECPPEVVRMQCIPEKNYLGIQNRSHLLIAYKIYKCGSLTHMNEMGYSPAWIEDSIMLRDTSYFLASIPTLRQFFISAWCIDGLTDQKEQRFFSDVELLQVSFVEEMIDRAPRRANPLFVSVYRENIVRVNKYAESGAPLYCFSLPSNVSVVQIRGTCRHWRQVNVWVATRNGDLFKSSGDIRNPDESSKELIPLGKTAHTALRVVNGKDDKDVAIVGRVDGTIAWILDERKATPSSTTAHDGAVKAIVTHELLGYGNRLNVIASLGEDCKLVVQVLNATNMKIHLLSSIPLNVPKPTLLSMGPCDVSTSPAYVIVAGEGIEVVEICRKKLGPCVLKRISQKTAKE